MQAPAPQSLVGLLVVDKPLGWSSMDVVRHVRRATGVRKVGHAGTLDPLATGVVIACIGAATKAVPRLMGMTKIYEAEVDLSAFTTTDDREGPREEVAVAAVPDEAALRAAIAGFVGLIEQVPPAFSAVHVDGQRAYKMARRGEDVVLKPRTVRIDAIELLGYAWPIARLRITCGQGTYIRSLARDLGKALGTGGHLASLRRTAVGAYTLAMAVDGARLPKPVTQGDLLRVSAMDA
jgi:tRNA pseudouridine55 synthase